MRAVILLLCLTTTAWASHSNIVNHFDPSRPEPLCEADGQYLLHGQNRCKFLRCTYGSEPWQDAEGNTRFYAVERSCPYGTAVSRAAYSKQHHADLGGRRLCADRVAPHHGGIRYYDPCSVEIPHYPKHNGYPTRHTIKQSKYTTTESKAKSHTPSKSQYPAYNPYSAHFPSFHYQVRKADSKRYPNKPAGKPSAYSPHYGHPAAHYPAYPSAYNHHPYPAYLSYPAKTQEETQEVEQVVEADLPDQQEPQAENQVEEAPALEEEEDGEVEEVVPQEAAEEAAPEEAAEAAPAEATADAVGGGPEVMEEGTEGDEGGEEEDSATDYTE